MSATHDVCVSFGCEPKKSRDIKCFVRSNGVDDMVLNARSFRTAWFGGADVEPAINLHRINADDLSANSLGDQQRNRGFPTRGRPRDIDWVHSGPFFGERWRGLRLLPPGKNEQQPNPGANRHIGNVECGESDFAPAALLKIKIDEVDDMPAKEPIDQVPDDAAKNQAERDLAEDRPRIKMAPIQKQKQKRNERYDCEELVISMEHAPRSAGVAPMDELEKAVDDNAFFAAKNE